MAFETGADLLGRTWGPGSEESDVYAQCGFEYREWTLPKGDVMSLAVPTPMNHGPAALLDRFDGCPWWDLSRPHQTGMSIPNPGPLLPRPRIPGEGDRPVESDHLSQTQVLRPKSSSLLSFF